MTRIINLVKDYALPMTYEGFAFTDKVSGKSVNYYRTRGTNTQVMAERSMAWFRVKRSSSQRQISHGVPNE